MSDYRKIIAIDFDGCLFTNAYPDIGEPIMVTINAALEEKERGSALILWTCRNGKHLQDAIKACEDVGLTFDAVNANLPNVIEAFGGDTRKIVATEYWDDAARCYPIDLKVEFKSHTFGNIGERIDAYMALCDEFPGQRAGIMKAAAWSLNNAGFFTSPASAKHHLNYAGGLFDHSYNVAKILIELTQRMHLKWMSKESPLIIGMFHDLCKCDEYYQSIDGTIEFNKLTLFGGHGEKSLIVLNSFIPSLPTTIEEKLCIRYHMGAFTDKSEWSYYTNAIHFFPNVLWTHQADMIAAHIAEEV